MTRPDIDRPAAGGAHVEPLHGPHVRRQHRFPHRGMDQDGAARVVLQIFRPRDGEAVELRVEAPPAHRQLLARQPLEQTRPRQAGGVDPVHPEHGPGVGQVRPQLVRADWPAAVRHPVAPLEIDRIIFGAAAAPDRGGSAEEAQPAMLERMIFLADNLAAVEVGGRLVMVEAAAFDQNHALLERQQPARGRLAGGAGPDNRDISRNGFWCL